MNEQQWDELWNTAIDVQYLIVKAGGMANKTIVEDYLMQRYSLDHYTIREATNYVMDKFYFRGGQWYDWNAKRPAPKFEDHPGLAEWLAKNGPSYPHNDRLILPVEAAQ